jgi:hypothetical protein
MSENSPSREETIQRAWEFAKAKGIDLLYAQSIPVLMAEFADAALSHSAEMVVELEKGLNDLLESCLCDAPRQMRVRAKAAALLLERTTK